MSEQPALSVRPTYIETLRDSDRSGPQRTAIAIAVVVHLAALAVTVPQLYSDDLADDEEDKKVFMLEPVKFRPPPPPPPEAPPPPRASVPVPDLTPDDPEPVPFEDPPLELQIANIDLALTVPDGPPAPPEPPLPVAPPPDIQLQVGVDVEAPERLHFVEPKYTRMAIRTGLRGAVVLQLTIDKQGQVKDVVVRKKMPLGLTESAVSAVSQWRFRPTLVDGRPMELLYVVTVNFRPNSRQRFSQ